MNDQVFEWMIGALAGVFGATAIALWTLQLRMETRLTNWMKNHLEEDSKKHDEFEKMNEKQEAALHAAELESLKRFATKSDVDKVFMEIAGQRTHFDNSLNGVNSRLDLVLLNMRPGKD